MNSLWQKLSLKQKLQLPIQLILLVILVLTQYAALDAFEQQVLEEARQKAEVSADGVLNGLNMLMLNGIIRDADQRKLFVEKMGASDKVLELRVMRNTPVIDQFGPGMPSEQAQDEMDRLALSSGRLQSALEHRSGKDALRVVVPFIARQEFRGTNCLMCHIVPEGSVNGAASITLDASEEFALIAKVNAVLWGVQVADAAHALADGSQRQNDVAKVASGAVAEVETGIEPTRKNGAGLQEIMNATVTMTQHIERITQASGEQSAAGESVAARLENITRLVSENAHSVQLAQKAAEELEKVADKSSMAGYLLTQCAQKQS